MVGPPPTESAGAFLQAAPWGGMQSSPRLYLFAGLVAVVLLGGVAFAASQLPGGGDVGVEQAYFVAAEPAGDQLNLTARLFVTNDGRGASDRLSVSVFVVPTHSGLASYTTRVEVGTIDGRATEEVTVPVVVPSFNATRSYRVDFLIFEDGLLTQKGSGTIGWGGGHWSGSSFDEATLAKADGLTVSAPTFDRVG